MSKKKRNILLIILAVAIVLFGIILCIAIGRENERGKADEDEGELIVRPFEDEDISKDSDETQPGDTNQSGGTEQPGEATQPGGTEQPGEATQPGDTDQPGNTEQQKGNGVIELPFVPFE